jgi:metallo-beta-lactamase family protein
MAKLTFLGAAGTVTGSRYLVDLGDRRVLVDCGLFQGLKELRLRNWEPLPVPASRIDAVVLTHAHVDHCGYLPRLVAGGFRGRVFCTGGTADLCRIMLPDAGRLAEEDAREANRGGYSRHQPALPLFTEMDALRALGQLQPFGFDRAAPVAPGLEVRFVNSGHLLGSAFVLMTLPSGRQVLFSGDVGRYDRPVLPDPSPAPRADVLLVESTYGDRVHEADPGADRLAAIVNDTVRRGGRLIIPAFAVGRVEEVIYWLKKLEEARRIPVLPVFVDSPMAVEALRNYANRANELDADVQAARGEVSRFCTMRFQLVSSPKQSAELAASTFTCIVLSSSGMATGGRILGHLKTALPAAHNTVLFTGYQAAGTRGRQLVEGATQVKIRGQLVPVAAKIELLESMSAHADAEELVRWLATFPAPPEKTWVVHGEPPAAEALKTRLAALGWNAEAAQYLQTVDL